MSARHANQIESLTGGLLMAMMISAERGAQRAADRRDHARTIAAHNAGIARARAARRQRAAIVAAQVALGEARMARWLDRVAH